MTNDFLNKMVEESEQAAESLSDKGHIDLISDLETILDRAKQGLFHDFHRNGLAASKIELVNHFEVLKTKVMNGAYDN